MSTANSPKTKQINQHYEYRVKKLDQKDNQFPSKKFHQIRKSSNPKKILHSFGRIANRLNDKEPSSINESDLNKVCFILMNTYKKKKENSFRVGPLNDGYLIALNHRRRGFKIFYLYNPRSDEFLNFLGFFVKHTNFELSVFYSGPITENNSIEFCNGSIPQDSVGDVITQNCNKNAHVLFVTDCCNGGSVFDIHKMNSQNFTKPSNMISIFTNKAFSPQSRECNRTHGLFTYYFCKIINEYPKITPYKLVEEMNTCLKRFSEYFGCDVTEKEIIDKPIFSAK